MSQPFSAEVKELLREGLATGRYANESDLLVEALRLLRDRDAHVREFQEQLKARLGRLDRGEGAVIKDETALRDLFDDVQERGWQRYRAHLGEP